MEKMEIDKQKAINDVIQLNEEAEIKLILEINKYNENKSQNPEKLINDVSVKNATLETFSKCKQNELTKFIHVRISIEKSIGKKALKNFGFKKLPNKVTIVTSRLSLENNSLDTLVEFSFHLRNQEAIME